MVRLPLRQLAATLFAGSVALRILACSSSYGSAEPEPAPGDAGDSGAAVLADAATEATSVEDAGCVAPPLDPSFLVAVEIGAGSEHTCARLTDGRVACWGSNAVGELGEAVPADGGADAGISFSVRPRPVVRLPPAQQLSVASSHACAILQGGEVWCWGNPTGGKVGNVGTFDAHAILTDADLPFKAVEVRAGSTMTCALVAGGSVWCWGSNDKGQLGVVAPLGYELVPRLLSLPAAATQLTLGSSHACTVLVGSGVTCWGSNAAGQLGSFADGGFTQTPRPYPKAASRVIAGPHSTCVLDDAGVPTCSGFSQDGSLGLTLVTATVTAPTVIPELAQGGVAQLAVGVNHTCGVNTTGEAFCFGSLDLPAALGRGTGHKNDPQNPIPMPVLGSEGKGVLSSIGSIVTGGSYAGYAHSCALVKPACAAAGHVYCWGSNGRGQLGDGTQIARDVPVRVLAP